MCTPLFLVLLNILSHDLGLRPVKIISLTLNKAILLGGSKTGNPQEKPPGLTSNQNLSRLTSDPSWAQIHSDELTDEQT